MKFREICINYMIGFITFLKFDEKYLNQILSIFSVFKTACEILMKIRDFTRMHYFLKKCKIRENIVLKNHNKTIYPSF